MKESVLASVLLLTYFIAYDSIVLFVLFICTLLFRLFNFPNPKGVIRPV